MNHNKIATSSDGKITARLQPDNLKITARLTEEEARQLAIKYGALCGQCPFLCLARGKCHCSRYNEKLAWDDMPVSYCDGYEAKKTR